MATERRTQKRVIELLVNKLDYVYLGDFSNKNNSNIIRDKLEAFLKGKYSDYVIRKGVDDLEKMANDQVRHLYETNKDVYDYLRYGHTVETLDKNAPSEHIHYIDWLNPLNNDFYVAEEVTVRQTTEKRPDLVLYINGIAIGVIELKRSSVSVSEGIRQNIVNQREDFIKQFFSTISLCLAGNDSEGLRYGTTLTPEKYFLKWKEDTKATDTLSKKILELRDSSGYSMDNDLISILSKERIIEIVYNFIVFDGGTKKICRPNQYFGVIAAKQRLALKEGGIIWHTQGSGKSLTMVWLSRIIKESNSDARVLIITDREELDYQISTSVFGSSGSGDSIYRTNSGQDLIDKINGTTPPSVSGSPIQPVTICSLIHKFGRRSNSDIDQITDRAYNDFIEDLISKLPPNFSPKGQFYVFVDECHRTQSGKLHKAMKTIIPNAIFIGFTGTPLLASQKKPGSGQQSSIEVFGTYIHTYKYNEAVEDNVVLDLRYEARNIPQELTSRERIDAWFDIKTRGLTKNAKIELKKRWGTLENIFSSMERLNKIVCDISFDMEKYPRLSLGKGNAILVASSIYDACRYYELFQRTELKDKCAIVTSFTGSEGEIRTGDSGEGETENIFKYNVYRQMLKGMDSASFEKMVKKQFIDEPDRMKLLIVVDKLLTGFDAPPATYLYIDKPMKNHGLFQAVCRVNRLDGDDNSPDKKEYGYIIDYKDLFKELELAVTNYTSEALDGFDKEDVSGLLKSRKDEAKRHFLNELESIRAICEHIDEPKDVLDYQHYFCAKESGNQKEIDDNENKRLTFYKKVASIIRAWADYGQFASYDMTSIELNKLIEEIKIYVEMRDQIKLCSGDYIDLKAYEPAMRQLLDNYISAKESEVLTSLQDFSLVELLAEEGFLFVKKLNKQTRGNQAASSEIIENNVRKKIIEKNPTNPKYYDDLSVLLDNLIQQRKQSTIEYAEYLQKIVELTRRLQHPEEEQKYPKDIRKSPAKRALFDNIKEDVEFVNQLHNIIILHKPDNWIGDSVKEQQLKRVIYNLVRNTDDVEKIFKVIKDQREYR
ncbi:MAG: HsdR family type I site-specific deoxyribonuclease [Bacilli bacterium]|nr:HsdR family type I site-specific deoxyribonuclease [Bacilli bacterium]